jgi:hypothetical protein
MPIKTDVEVIEDAPPENYEVPEVEVRGDEAVIRVERPEGVEERRVKLPRTTWG